MPRKPQRGCAYPGCPRLTDGQYCDEHKRLIDWQYNRYGRPMVSQRAYGRVWKKIRDRYAAEHPLCELCLKEGRLTPVTEVHHIVPVTEGGTNEPSNLLSVCRHHHLKLHRQTEEL